MPCEPFLFPIARPLTLALFNRLPLLPRRKPLIGPALGLVVVRAVEREFSGGRPPWS